MSGAPVPTPEQAHGYAIADGVPPWVADYGTAEAGDWRRMPNAGRRGHQAFALRPVPPQATLPRDAEASDPGLLVDDRAIEPECCIPGLLPKLQDRAKCEVVPFCGTVWRLC